MRSRFCFDTDDNIGEIVGVMILQSTFVKTFGFLVAVLNVFIMEYNTNLKIYRGNTYNLQLSTTYPQQVM